MTLKFHHSLYYSLLLLVFTLCACSQNPFLGTWSGSNNKGNYRVEINKDHTFISIQEIPYRHQVCSINGTWSKIDEEIIELKFSRMTISDNKNGLWQLDANAKEYSADPGILYLRKDGAFGDSFASLDYGNFYLYKQNN